MIQKILETKDSEFHWIDIVDPSREELEQIGQKYGIHHTSIQDCLDPEHLPKFERIGELTFIITRAFDENAPSSADEVRDLTRKTAMFVGDKFLITVHRKEQQLHRLHREKWTNQLDVKSTAKLQILGDLINAILFTYYKPVDQAILELDHLETKLFKEDAGHGFLHQMYYLKRKASVFKRMARMSIDVVQKIQSLQEKQSPIFQDLRESADDLYFYTDDLLENVNNIINLHISLSSHKTNEASHRTNEVVRLLTVFSVFFMPLNFIAGLYGMNFEHMPELRLEWAYPAVLVLMITVSLGIFLWFRKQGWLR